MILKNYTDGMEIISPDLRDSLLNRLHTLIKDTERVFLTVGEDLPSLLKEMTRGINEARAAIENFREEGCLEDETDCRNVHAIISETQELINVSSQSFQQMHEQDAELFEELNTGIENLSSLERIIGNIKEDSIEMELISLNAMTAALKSGSAGKAFSYITEELKRLSENTISFTDELTQRGDRTLELFHRFRDQVASISDFQNKLFKNFRTKLDDSFSQYNMGLNQIMEALENIIDTAETIKKPLTTIMEEIQLQDIIKQSVDHVIIAVKEINTELSKDRSEALLDELSYLGNLADLSQSMLNDIADKVQSSLDIFNEQTREARGIIEGVDEKKTSFMQNFMEEEGEIALRRIFSDAAEALRKTLEDLDSSMSKKQSLYQTSSELTSEVRVLEDNFQAFTTITRRFHNIDVASRIEVAKQESLKDMRGTVEEMTELSHRISADVNEALELTKSFILSTQKTIDEYNRLFLQEEEIVSNFQGSIRSSYEEMHKAEEAMVRMVSGFSAYTGRFRNLFTSADQNLENMQLLLKDIHDIQSLLVSVRERANKEYNDLLEQLGKESWELKDQRLKEIIERFTIFTHKEAASRLGGFDVEEGKASGDITLF